ncbi:MAG: bactofilin family protein, partial [Candidatus Acidiferrales bacterium]
MAGTEDLFIDGSIEGKITLTNSAITVGPNGTVKADISAREIVLRGLAEGKFTAEERIQIWSTARVQGELKSERISIEDGAELRGKVEAGKSTGKVAARGRVARGYFAGGFAGFHFAAQFRAVLNGYSLGLQFALDASRAPDLYP